MALYTKCILKQKEDTDGMRISIMSRHTENDGITPDQRITSDSFDIHYSELAPSPGLIGDYYKRALPWEEFEERFNRQMASDTALKKIVEIAELALYMDVTLLCIEETADFCHRRLVADICLQFHSDLVIVHR